MDPAANNDRLAELKAAAVAARQRIDFLWQASDPDWSSIELAVDDLSVAVGLIVADQGVDEADNAIREEQPLPLAFHRAESG